MDSVDKKILSLLAKNARTSSEDIATITGESAAAVEQRISALEDMGVIRGYKGVIDWEKLDNAYVSAVIELKVIPQAELGFERIAETIMKYKEVESVYLMSGNYDLNVIVKGKTLQDVARFVAKELATIAILVCK